MNVEKIVKAWLTENKYAGLCNPEIDCACWIDDLMPCEVALEDCVAGHKELQDGDWIIVVKKEQQ